MLIPVYYIEKEPECKADVVLKLSISYLKHEYRYYLEEIKYRRIKELNIACNKIIKDNYQKDIKSISIFTKINRHHDADQDILTDENNYKIMFENIYVYFNGPKSPVEIIGRIDKEDILLESVMED